MNPKIKKLYGEIARTYGLDYRRVSDIIEKQFRFVKGAMAEGEKNNPETYKNIQITHLGKFATRKYKLEEYARKANGEDRE